MDITKLYPYQLKTARNLSARFFGADLSEVGTGKTITALAVINMTGALATLIVAPKSVAEQWERKAHEWSPELKIVRTEGDAKARAQSYLTFAMADSPKVLITTYEHVRSDIDRLSAFRFDVIYADECHRLGNPTTKLYKAFIKLKGERRYGATATPLRSSPLQAYGIFNWLQTGLLGRNYFNFQYEYTVKNARGWAMGYKNLDRLAAKIAPHFIKNKMEDVGVYLPPLIEEEIIFKLGAHERRLYDNIVKEMLLEIKAAEISKIENPTNLYNSVVKLGKLQELTDSWELLGDSIGGTSVDSTKLSVLKDHLENVVGTDKVVIFTRFSRMADILARELAEYNPALITGAIKDRQGEIDKFDSVENCKVIIITTAGNEGINLQRANVLYMVDVPLGSYGSLVQTIGRINRIGQTRPMVVYYLLAKGTVDVRLKALLESKKDMAEKMFNSLQDVRNMLE